MITPREWMVELREKQGLSIDEIAHKCNAASNLLDMLEKNKEIVTHPKIAERIALVYGMSDAQYEGLLPEIRRQSSPKYEPNKYVKPVTFHQQVDYKKLEENDNDKGFGICDRH